MNDFTVQTLFTEALTYIGLKHCKIFVRFDYLDQNNFYEDRTAVYTTIVLQINLYRRFKNDCIQELCFLDNSCMI